MPEVGFASALIGRILFFLLVGMVLCTRGRTRILGYVWLTNVDLFTFSSEPAVAVGVTNVIKILILPLYIIYVEGIGVLLKGSWRVVAALWTGLTLYCAVAVVWSPYPLAGAKMVAYLVSYGVLFLVFLRQWQLGALDRGFVLACLWGGLVLGLLQSYALGDPYGLFDEASFAPRFTSFTSPQSFALSFLILSGMTFLFRKRDFWFLLSLASGSMAIIFSGSRYVFISLVTMCLLGALGQAVRSDGVIKLRAFLDIRVVTATASLLLLVFVIRIVPGNRIQELIGSSEASNVDYERIGTVALRLALYEDAWNRVMNFRPSTVLLGAGTSSAAEIKLDVMPEYNSSNVDANRSLHNEFARAFYEWGAVGLVLLLSVCLLLTWKCARLGWALRPRGVVPFIGPLVGLWLSLSVENILSNAGAPGGTAIAMFLAVVAFLDQSAPQIGWAAYGNVRGRS